MYANSQQDGELESILKMVNPLQISSQTLNSGTGTQINNKNSGNGKQYVNNSSGKQWNAEIQNFVDIKQKEDFSFRGPVGPCLRQAPQIAPGPFIGRESELNTMAKHLCETQHRPCLALGGVGGIGKTRLALTYAELHFTSYGSVFWINAASEATLRDSFRSIAGLIFQVQDPKVLEGKEVIGRVHHWLSDTKNPSWLMIFDNYDDDSDQFNISDYYPPASQGAIIVTTRRADIVTGRTETLHIKAFQNIEDSLAILETRSKRLDVQSDRYAKLLVERLGGLPLALATAGTYLQRSPLTFERYLQEYEKRWDIDPRRPTKPQDYERTLYTTWDISYDCLKKKDLDAAKLLKLLAYFSNQGLWYELFSNGLTDKSSEWLHDMFTDDVSFQGVMIVLTDWSFLELDSSSGSWSMHKCVHDWALAALNKDINIQYYWFAVDCVNATIRGFDEPLFGNIIFYRSTGHAARLANQRFLDVIYDPTPDQLEMLSRVSYLLQSQIQLTAAEQIYKRALAGKETALGPNHSSTLDTVDDLGNLYGRQGKLDEAEQMYKRALAGKEKALGPDHISTLGTVNNLGNLYGDQGRLDEAEKMYKRALAGKETALGLNHSSTLNTVNNLGTLYGRQGKLDEAEQMFMWALAGKEKALGPNHLSTLDTINNLGTLYGRQGKLDKAEKIYKWALAGKEKALGPDHISTLTTVNNLGNLYSRQGKIDKAEKMFMRALAGKEKALGSNHTSTLTTVNNLGNLYCDQDKLNEAEQMFKRALAGYEKALGPDHTSTLSTVNNLGNLYCDQDKLDEAEQMYKRALAGKEKALGSDHISTLTTVNNLGNLYYDQDKLDEAEQMFKRALAGYEKALGPDHISTLTTARDLALLYRDQGKLSKAAQFLWQAAAVK
ncbi:hypothetical protein N7490_005444 [Penicillium lividum]|nr:hypothetical protein N7490_005444 [Penicillium lividum]